MQEGMQRSDMHPRLHFSRFQMSDSTRAPSGVSYVKAPSRDQVSDNKPVEALVTTSYFWLAMSKRKMFDTPV